jgi:hypothetical protein
MLATALEAGVEVFLGQFAEERGRLRQMRPPPHRPQFRKNRHCLNCQGPAARDGMAARAEDLLPVEYVHVVWTLPAEIARIAYWNRKAVDDPLLRVSAETVMTIAAVCGLRRGRSCRGGLRPDRHPGQQREGDRLLARRRHHARGAPPRHRGHYSGSANWTMAALRRMRRRDRGVRRDRRWPVAASPCRRPLRRQAREPGLPRLARSGAGTPGQPRPAHPCASPRRRYAAVRVGPHPARLPAAPGGAGLFLRFRRARDRRRRCLAGAEVWVGSNTALMILATMPRRPRSPPGRPSSRRSSRRRMRGLVSQSPIRA